METNIFISLSFIFYQLILMKLTNIQTKNPVIFLQKLYPDGIGNFKAEQTCCITCTYCNL